MSKRSHCKVTAYFDLVQRYLGPHRLLHSANQKYNKWHGHSLNGMGENGNKTQNINFIKEKIPVRPASLNASLCCHVH